MKSDATSILVVVEHDGGVLRKSAFEVLAAARRWPLGGKIVAMALGAGAEAAARESTRWGAHQAGWLDQTGLPMCWLRAVEQAAGAANATSVLLADSTLGRDVAPRLAVRLNASFAAGVLEVEALEEGLRLTRPIFGGRFLESLSVPGHKPVVMTWRGRRPEGAVGETATGAVVQCLQQAADPTDRLVRVVDATVRKERDLSEADVVVCGGRGMGSREGFGLVYALAGALGGAAAASRAAVDAGYAPVELQVGQSGKTVRPRFYFALGVSGSMQHRAGMRSSRCVVAINSDPSAPILCWADYAMVGDVAIVVPALIEELRR